MALIHSPSTTTRNGLVVHLDAANPKSYSGTGTTWYDMSGNSNHAILNGNANNPVWNAAGYWSFPATTTGINGGMIINNSSSLQTISTMTVELFFTLETKTLVSGDTDWMAIFSKGSTRSNQTPAISINQGVSSNRFLHIETPSAFNSSPNIFTDYTGNIWYYVTALLSSTSFGYLNNQQVSTVSGGITANSFPIYLGLDSGLEMFKGKLAIVRVYNRALTFSELTDNFNAMKRRFAL
jgi:hypothetical protein